MQVTDERSFATLNEGVIVIRKRLCAARGTYSPLPGRRWLAVWGFAGVLARKTNSRLLTAVYFRCLDAEHVLACALDMVVVEKEGYT